MKIKEVQQILPPPAPHMVGDGFRVHNFFPSGYDMDQKRMSPFLMLDYNSKIDFSPTENPRGVGVHPHRGFETVTISYHGKVAHHDSAGNSGVISEGDVQWMTAASGVLHKEYHEKEFSRAGGPFQMVQLWINLPAKDKMSKPGYQTLENRNIPKYVLPEDKGVVEVIAGEFKNVKGAAHTFTALHMYNLKLKKGAEINFNLPSTYNTGLLVVDGSASVNNQSAKVDHFVLFKNEGEEIQLKAESDVVLLLLSGEPINEPIAAYGPFVMNSKAELMEAYEDYNKGKFGVLED